MKIEKVKTQDIKLNPNNPRIIKDDKFKKLVKSIQDFPEMLEIRPIVVNDDMVVLGGNMRLKACQEAKLEYIYIIKASNLTQEQQEEFIIKDNISFGDWNYELLNSDWSVLPLEEWGLDFKKFEIDSINELEEWNKLDMPEFETVDKSIKLIVYFNTEDDRELFCKDKNIEIKNKKNGQWIVKI